MSFITALEVFSAIGLAQGMTERQKTVTREGSHGSAQVTVPQVLPYLFGFCRFPVRGVCVWGVLEWLTGYEPASPTMTACE